ncbi:hypothetical protein A2U01_0058921 [Trifolium medium]|uniref:Uncharacterized protein n=1 Tax=Trifolium medium TaxID=97028 RepID=A0A392RN52_9FABA|nr:hypothetical protein [Trifolium medium]
MSKPDRPIGPVKLGTGEQSGPVRPGNRGAKEPEKKRANRRETGKTDEPAGSDGLAV